MFRTLKMRKYTQITFQNNTRSKQTNKKVWLCFSSLPLYWILTLLGIKDPAKESAVPSRQVCVPQWARNAANCSVARKEGSIFFRDLSWTLIIVTIVMEEDSRSLSPCTRGRGLKARISCLQRHIILICSQCESPAASTFPQRMFSAPHWFCTPAPVNCHSRKGRGWCESRTAEDFPESRI